MPTNEFRVTIEQVGSGRTRMSIVSTHPSTEAMEQLLAFGMDQGLTESVGPIDAVLADDAAGRRRRADRRQSHRSGFSPELGGRAP